VVRIAEVNDGQIAHTLVIDGIPGFKLSVPTHGVTDQAAVRLDPGTYIYYCDIPGHRQVGMEGTLTVIPATAGS
jgi:plastocyanin